MRKAILWILSLVLIVSLIGNYFFFQHLQGDKRLAKSEYENAVAGLYNNLYYFNETLETFMDEIEKTDRDEVQLMRHASWLQHIAYRLDEENLKKVLSYRTGLHMNEFRNSDFNRMASDIFSALNSVEGEENLHHIKEKVDVFIELLPEPLDYLELNANEEEALWEEIILTIQQME